MNFPVITKDLLDYLNSAYPPKNPDLHDTDRVIWRDMGKRELVDALQTIFDQQQAGSNTGEGIPNVFRRPTSAATPAALAEPGSGSGTSARTPGSPGNQLRG